MMQSSEPATELSVSPLPELGLQRHSELQDRRRQQSHLALVLGALSLLACALLALVAAPAWLSFGLPLPLAVLFVFFAHRLPHGSQPLAVLFNYCATLLPPALVGVWALNFSSVPSVLVLPFLLQPVLLLLACLPLRAYVLAILYNFALASLLVVTADVLASVGALLVLLLISTLGVYKLLRALRSQRRLRAMRQRVVENTEKMAERNQKMRKLALEDPLTGLANRLCLINQLRRLLKNPHTEAIHSVVFLIDLDFFKTVNDEYGHAAGDALLIEIAQRFKALVRRGDLVCRLGGDEFVILVRGLTGPEQIRVVADKILARLAEPVWYQEQRLPLGGSVGIAPWLPELRSPASWLQAADDAMYQAKSGGRNRYVIADFAQ
ncbi:diguanylate cyclase [Chitinibacter sp. GC72]|uniref:GGDEF domain-containing protein n=1 Tax=Chitinibacter sp. GC72 TaxID=1526917 RepID=UPI0012FCB62C|nr:GGDEF domain-containing protein [Chitinibacter sp. GC72]